MILDLHPLPLAAPSLPALADWLLGRCRDLEPHTRGEVLVLLPSPRVCDQLAHALLERSGGEALILPRLTTPAHLAGQLADLVDGAGVDAPMPAEALRPLALAPRLARLPWLQARPEAADGLAQELVALFDELRRAGRDQEVLDGGHDERLLGLVDPAAAEVLAVDLERIRAAWRCYREVLPRDQVDRQLAALTAAATRWPGRPPAFVVAAHLGRLDQVVVQLLRALPAQGVAVHWLAAAADDPRSQLLLATYRDQQSPAHPLRAIGKLAARLGLTAPPGPVFAGADLHRRLGDLGQARRLLAPGGPLRLLACRDAEHESRVVADAVGAELAEAAQAGRPAPTVLVATADRDLAARIGAQLADAGLNVDDTRGRPLASLPAGRLLRDLLRTAAGGWAYAPLFEVLTHPYVRLGEAGASPSHAVRVLVLEAAVRRARAARRGRDLLRSLAGDDDARDGGDAGIGRGWSLAAFVDEVAAAIAPLDALAGGGVYPWADIMAAVRGAWRGLATLRPLDAEPEPGLELDDTGAVGVLLDALAEATPWLEHTTLAAAAAVVGDLLRGPVCEVRPHRQRHLPVRVVGLVEARLEVADLLVLAGMSQDVFPGRLARPLLLPDALRQRMGLQTWRALADEKSELFLRLMHAAPRVVITWPREREGRDALPSPLVQRLLLAADREPEQAGEPVLRRRAVPEVAALVAAEARHRAEPEPITAPRAPRPTRLSHSALQRHRECPYRFLLADSLGLRRLDPLDQAYGPADVGNLAHAVMHRWLDPRGGGWAAIAVGDRTAALTALHEAVAHAAAERATELPGDAVAAQALLADGRDLVDHELERATVWQPAALEAGFTLSLGQAVDWLAAADPDLPAIELPASWRDVPLQGKIDRVDRRRDGAPIAAVLDYKTGTPPAKSSVKDGRELQIHLYALAVEAGAVDGLAAWSNQRWCVEQGGYYALIRGKPGMPATAHLTDRADLVAGVRAIVAQVLQILDPQVPYALVPDWRADQAVGSLPCRTCEFRGVCRLEERDTTPALAARLGALLAATPRRTA